MYASFNEYSQFYSDIEEGEYSLYGTRASLELDKQTTGIDGYKKLKNAFPEDEDDANAITYCAIELAHTLKSIENATSYSDATMNEDGLLVGRQIASISSGSESVSYVAPKNAYETLAVDAKAKKMAINTIVRDYLSGVCDKNGVNLLYMGAYPYV